MLSIWTSRKFCRLVKSHFKVMAISENISDEKIMVDLILSQTSPGFYVSAAQVF